MFFRGLSLFSMPISKPIPMLNSGRRLILFSVLSSSLVVNLASTPAFAQTQPGAQPSMLEALLPFVVLMGLMYFLLLRPQVKKAKEHQKFITELKRGDDVVTTGGILGKIEGLTDVVVTLEV